MSQTTRIFEHVTSNQPLKVDAEKGIIFGVKILGSKSKNGREYALETMRAAVPLYEGAKVNVNHPRGAPAGPRDYQDRIGCTRAVECREDGLYGNLHFNPKHALAEQLVWDAQHAPENVGLSHNIDGKMSHRNGRVIVESIKRVISVDLVADPATNSSLYESVNMTVNLREYLNAVPAGTNHRDALAKILEDDAGLAVDAPAEAMPDQSSASPDDQVAAAFEAMVVAVVRDKKLDVAGKAKKIKDILMSHEKLTSKPDAGAKPEDGAAKESIDPVVAQLREELNAMKAEKGVRSLVESLGVVASEVAIEAATALPEAKRKSFLESLPKRDAKPKSGTQPRSSSFSAIQEGQSKTTAPKLEKAEDVIKYLRTGR